MYTLSETLYDSSNSFSAGGGHCVDDYGDCLGAAHDTGSWVKISRNINLAGGHC